MMMTAKRKSSIPDEIIHDIFSRLPIKSLMRFKCISKYYHSLVLDSYFADVHQSRSISCPDQRTKLLLLASGQENFYTIDLKLIQPKASVLRVEGFDVIRNPKFSYAKGLLCSWSEKTINHAIIFNPSTREVRFLPRHVARYIGTRSYFYSGFDLDKKRHKILMTAYRGIRTSRHMVFTLGTDESWREIKSIPEFYPSTVEGIHIDGAVYLHGVTYAGGRDIIVEFNIRTEEFRSISLWNNTTSHYYPNQLVEVEGKLGAVDLKWSGDMQIWILQSPEREEWELISTSVLPACWKNQVYPPTCSGTFNGHEILLIYSRVMPNWIFFYDLKKNSWREIEVLGLGENVKITGICSYEDSLCYLGHVDVKIVLEPMRHWELILLDQHYT